MHNLCQRGVGLLGYKQLESYGSVLPAIIKTKPLIVIEYWFGTMVLSKTGNRRVVIIRDVK
jgi:hypothetical protein